MNLKQQLIAGLALVSVAGASMAQATGPDVTEIVDIIKGCGIAIAAVGVASLSVYYGGRVYRWLRGASG